MPHDPKWSENWQQWIKHNKKKSKKKTTGEKVQLEEAEEETATRDFPK